MSSKDLDIIQAKLNVLYKVRDLIFKALPTEKEDKTMSVDDVKKIEDKVSGWLFILEDRQRNVIKTNKEDLLI